MEIPPRFIIHESQHWLLNHRINSALPGYLVLSAKQLSSSLSTLPVAAQAELGMLLAQTQQVMEDHLQPTHLYISRYGHDPGHSIHFHFIPVFPWVEALFWEDQRYRLLETFGSVPSEYPLTDGAELTLFIWREFCERPDPPSAQGQTVDEIISTLRTAFANGR